MAWKRKRATAAGTRDGRKKPKSKESSIDRLVSQVNQRLLEIADDASERRHTTAVCEALATGTESGYQRAAQLIEKHGVTFDITTKNQNVLHMWACGLNKMGKSMFADEKHQRKVLTPLWNLFLRHHVERHVNTLDLKHGLPPLHFTFGWGTNVAMNLLLSLEETNINVLSQSGDTALMHGLKFLCTCDDCKNRPAALLSCYLEVIKYHYAKLDLSIRNRNGHTLTDMIHALPTAPNHHSNHTLKTRWARFIDWMNNEFYPCLAKIIIISCEFNEPALASLILSYLH